MKRIFFIALIICFTYSLYYSYEQMKNYEIEKLASIEREFASPFMIPEHSKLSDSKKVFELLEKTAAEAEVNLFRGARFFRTNEKVEIIKYLLLSTQTNFFKYIHLENGRTFEEKETKNEQLFLSTVQTNDTNQIGRIRYFDRNQLLTVQPLQLSYEYLPIHGRYFVEAKDEQQIQFFLKILSEEINNFIGVQDLIGINDLQPPEAFTKPHKDFFALSSLSEMKTVQYILFAATMLLLLYYIFNETKRIGILKMHGTSNLRIWWTMAGKLITLTTLIFLILSLFMIFGLKLPKSFLIGAFLQIGKVYFILIALSLPSYAYISALKVNQMIKHRKDTKWIFYLNMILKMFCAVGLILLSLEAFTQYATFRTKQEQIYAEEMQINNWTKVADYGIIKAYAGHTTAYNFSEFEQDMSRGDRLLLELYPVLNKQGALYIDAGQYEQTSLLLNQNFNGIRSIMVNPNYLETFPIYDYRGRQVEIPETTSEWILLVPEKYKNREKDIYQYFENDTKIREFFLTHDEGQSLKIIWLADEQYIFSVNPDVFPSEHNRILDPIIHVKTEQNHLFTYRSGIKGRGLRDPIKIKLLGQNSFLTYERLKPELKRLNIDNMISVVSFQQYVSEELNYLSSEMKKSLLTMIGIFSVFLFLIVQNLVIFFHHHQKKFIIKRLFGISFFRTYQSVFGWFAVISITFIVTSHLIDHDLPQYSRLITENTDIPFLVVAFSLLSIEILVTIIALIIIEQRNKSRVLKEGN